jgi:iron-sulfur cluster repair protein YtfE (RIC family)
LLRCPALFPVKQVTQSVLLVDGFNLNFIKDTIIFSNYQIFFCCGRRIRTSGL